MKPSNQGKMKSKIRKTNMVRKWVTLSQTHLKWFNTEDELRGDNYSGAVKLPFIFEVDKFTVKNKCDSFRLGVSLYEQRGKEHAGKRDLIFTCKNPFERDKWIAGIDYLKTRAIYEAYQKNNRLVSFMTSVKK